MNSLGLTWSHLDSLGLVWSHLEVPVGSFTLSSPGFTWTHLASLGLTWTHLASLGLSWIHLDSLGLTSHVLEVPVEKATTLGEKGGDGNRGGRIIPEYPSPILHAPRDNISVMTVPNSDYFI